MPPTRYQVFISSTFDDLHQDRLKAIIGVMRIRQFPVGMEVLTAADERGWGQIQKLIDTSDYYVVIVGGRYGSVDEEVGMSWTEREYDYAGGRPVKRLAFIRKDGAINLDKTDRDPKKKKRLDQFKKKLQGAHLIEWWDTTDDLVGKVQAALTNQIACDQEDGTLPVGWVRGGSAPLAIAEELSRLSEENRTLREKVAALGSARTLAPRELAVGAVVLQEGVENEVGGHWRPAAISNNVDVQSAFAGFRLRITNPPPGVEPGAESLGICVRREGWAGTVGTSTSGVIIERVVAPDDSVENKVRVELDDIPSHARDYLFHFGPQHSFVQTAQVEQEGVRCMVEHYTLQGKRRFELLVRPKGLLPGDVPGRRWIG